MRAFLTLFPIYLIGNLHCLGMCGPLVFLLGKHPYRHLYFIGRFLSYALAGLLAGEIGAVINLILMRYQVGAVASLLFGGVLIILAICSLRNKPYPGYRWLAKRTSSLSTKFSLLMSQNLPAPAFLFGFFTILLPCGQTLFVFSALALEGDPLTGFANGFAFALLTSPSLWLGMSAKKWLGSLTKKGHLLTGSLGLFVGTLALLRGLADLEVIAHFGYGHFILW